VLFVDPWHERRTGVTSQEPRRPGVDGSLLYQVPLPRGLRAMIPISLLYGNRETDLRETPDRVSGGARIAAIPPHLYTSDGGVWHPLGKFMICRKTTRALYRNGLPPIAQAGIHEVEQPWRGSGIEGR